MGRVDVRQADYRRVTRAERQALVVRLTTRQLGDYLIFFRWQGALEGYEFPPKHATSLRVVGRFNLSSS